MYGTWTAKHHPFDNSVWRPLRGPVFDHPLAVCDYRTVPFNDRVPTDIIFPDYLGETYNFWPNPAHRWYYLDGQQADEVLLVKCFDSKTETESSIAQCKFYFPGNISRILIIC